MKSAIRTILARVGYCSKPDFIIIGAQKAGTTGLFRTLAQHTHISSRVKETHYFSNDDLYTRKNLYDYHSNFPLPYKVTAGNKVLEGTPIYLYHPQVAKRLHDYNPDIKLIVALRNPVKRAFSAWTMYHYHFGTGPDKQYYDQRDFTTAIEEELSSIGETDFYTNKKGYVRRGIYHEQLEKYFDYFDREQILIVESKELLSFSEETSQRLQDFIGVPYQPVERVVSNKARVAVREDYSVQLQELAHFFKPHNEKLYDLIGEEYDWD